MNATATIRCHACREVVGFTFGELNETQIRTLEETEVTCFFCSKLETWRQTEPPRPAPRLPYRDE